MEEIEQLVPELGYPSDQFEKERQKRFALADQAAAMLQKVEDAVIRVIQLELRDDLDATSLTSLAVHLHNTKRLAALPAEISDRLLSDVRTNFAMSDVQPCGAWCTMEVLDKLCSFWA